jgi:hypothetical protein
VECVLALHFFDKEPTARVSTGHNSGPLNLLCVEPKRDLIRIGERSPTNREMSGKSLRKDDDISGPVRYR